MTSGPDISVVVPTHDRPDQLRRCLASLAAQSLPPGHWFDVVVVDDGSARPATATIEGVDVSVIRQAQSGPAAARNNGARASRAPLVAFIDDDCEAAPGWLAALLAAAQRFPGCAFGGRVVNDLVDDSFAEASQLIVSFLREYYGDASGCGRFFTSNNLAFDRQALLACGGFDVRYTRAAGEDRELCDRWVDTGGQIVFVPDAVVRHAHAMTLASFCRQHFQYGCGAWGFRRARASRSGDAVKVEPWTFYRDLLLCPVEAHGWRGLPLSALILLAQTANAAGFAVAALRHRPA